MTKNEKINLSILEVGKKYKRNDLLYLLNIKSVFPTGIREFSNCIFFYVTLNKKNKPVDHKYNDYFDKKIFHWQSQNRQDYNSEQLQKIINKDLKPQLFIRINENESFTFLGELNFLTFDDKTSNPVQFSFETLNFDNLNLNKELLNNIDELINFGPGNNNTREDFKLKTTKLYQNTNSEIINKSSLGINDNIKHFNTKIIIDDFLSNEYFWKVCKFSSSNLFFLWYRLKILLEFEGLDWPSNETAYLKRLNKENLYKPTTKDGKNFNSGAPARGLKVLFEQLGFIFVNDKNILTFTEIGRQFCNSNNLLSIKEKQLLKYQIYNPFNDAKLIDMKVKPHIFLLEILLNVNKNYLTKEEYILFVCRALKHKDIDYTLKKIEYWRTLSLYQQDKIINYLSSNIQTKRKNSLFKLIEGNAGYSIKFLGHANYFLLEDIESTKEIEFISIPKNKLDTAKKVLLQSNKATNLNINSKYEWIEYYGFDIKFYNDQDEDLVNTVNPNLFISLDENLLSARSINALKIMSVKYLGDLMYLSENYLLKERNLGRKSIIEIKKLMQKYDINFNQFDQNFEIVRNHQDFETFIIKINKRLDNLNKNIDKKFIDKIKTVENISDYLIKKTNSNNIENILKDFYGFEGTGRKTLENVGKINNLTRERIRQITNKFERKVKALFTNSSNTFILDIINNIEYCIKNNIPNRSETIIDVLKSKNFISSKEYQLNTILELIRIIKNKKTDFLIYTEFIDFKSSPKINKIIKFAKSEIDSNGCILIDRIADKFEIKKMNLETIFSSLENEFIFIDNNHSWITKKFLNRNRLNNIILKIFTITKKVNLKDLYDSVRREKRIKHYPQADIILDFCKKFYNVTIEDNHIIMNSEINYDLSDTDKQILLFFKKDKIFSYKDFIIQAEKNNINSTTAGIYLSKNPIIRRIKKNYYCLIGSNINFTELDNKIIQDKSKVKMKKEWGWTEEGNLWFGTYLSSSNIEGFDFSIPSDLKRLLTSKEYKMTSDNGILNQRIIKIKNSKIYGLKSIDFENATVNNQVIFNFYPKNNFIDFNIYKYDKIKQLDT